jgi:hypothetical protein
MASNWDIIKARTAAAGGPLATDSAIKIAERLWDSISSWIDNGNLSWTDRTYNLRDSIACGVYENGVLIRLLTMPDKKGSPKQYYYHKMRMTADGMRLVRETFTLRPFTQSGVHIVFRCPLNYGFFLEYGLGPNKLGSGDETKVGYGWWSNELVPQIKKEYKRIVNELVNN